MPGMRFYDPLLFLAGHRGAIERIAATRRAWVVGAVFVLSAGIARNYDHLDLLREPEWFIGPFVASLVSIVFIYLCIAGRLKLEAVGDYHRQWGTFLTLAWMTAPCAWIYGIPVESLTDIITATKWNIAFLAIVSLWRVALMTRALAVLTGVTTSRALVLILAPASFEMMVGSLFGSRSLVQIMGGVRLPPHTELLHHSGQFAIEVSFWVFLLSVWLCWRFKGVALTPLNRPWTGKFPQPALALAGASLAAWALAAPPFHGKIVNRDRLKEFVSAGRFPEAVAFASSKTRDDFPPDHYLPPAPDGRSFPLGLLDALPADAPEWLHEEWLSNAVEAFVLRRRLRSDTWEELVESHPAVAAGVEARAEELRSRPTLDWDDQDWLRDFDRLREAAKSSEEPEPREASNP
jgi:hypothetical protein